DLVGPALTAVNLAQVPASFVVGLLPWRLLAHRGTAILAAALILVGVPALLAPNALVIVGAAGLLGFVSACILVVCLALPALLGGERDVARLAAGGSTIGYTAAFLSNLLAGALWDASQIAAFALLPVLLGGIIALVLGPPLVAASTAGVGSPPDGRR